MIFPGQAEVDVRLYSIYVFSVRTEKKQVDVGNMASLLSTS